MAKFAILLMALLFIAHTCCASRRQDEPESCRDQIQNINLKKCTKHIMERIQSDDEEDDSSYITTVRGRINYDTSGEDQKEQELQKYCCSELQELDSNSCQCQALQKIMEKQSDKLEENEKKQMEKELKRVARRCNLGPMTQCDLSSQN